MFFRFLCKWMSVCAAKGLNYDPVFGELVVLGRLDTEFLIKFGLALAFKKLCPTMNYGFSKYSLLLGW